MRKKDKKKASKEALKWLLSNKVTLEKIRELFCMQEYDDKDVKATFRRCVKNFMDNDTVDNEESYWNRKLSKKNNDVDVDYVLNTKKIDPDDPTKVKRVSQNNQITSLIDALGGLGRK